MKTGFTLKDWLIIGGVGIGGIMLYGAYRKGADIIASVKTLDPTSPDNPAYQASSAIVRAITQQKDMTLGTWLYELLNPKEAAYDPNAKPGEPGYIGPPPNLRVYKNITHKTKRYH